MTLEPLAPETRNLIDGALRAASDGGTFDNVNPATDEVLGTCANATRDDVHRAVAAARRAFDQTDWSENHAFRARCLRQLLDGLREAKEQFRSIVVHEAGAPVSTTPFMHDRRADRDARSTGRRWRRRTSTSVAWPTSPSWARSTAASCGARRSASSARSRPGTSRCT